MDNKKKYDAIEAKNKAKEMLFLMQERARQAAAQFLDEDLRENDEDELPDSIMCPVCCEIMDIPERQPITLFPCGHTICKSCSEKNGNKCCECRAIIKSQAANITLCNIICKKSYTTKKEETNAKYPMQKASPTDRLKILEPLLKKATEKAQSLREENEIIHEEYDSVNDEYNFYLQQITEISKTIEKCKSELNLLIEDEATQKQKLAKLIPQYEKIKLLAGGTSSIQ